ncbi:MAG: hypothetical protein ACP5M1_05680 [Acidiphilium sp.]
MTKLDKHIRRYTTIAATIDILQRQQLPLLNPERWDDQNDRHFMKLYKKAKGIGGLDALCAASSSETYHHWRVFTSAADGVCIEIRRQDFENELEELQGVRFGEMEYLKISDIKTLSAKDVSRLPFLKRVGFSAESEYRIIAETDQAQASAYPVAFPLSLISRIYFNPWLPATIAESLTRTIRELKGCRGIRVVRSHLIDSETWKRSGDCIAGEPLLE